MGVRVRHLALAVALVSAACVAVSACDKPSPRSGYVEKLHFYDAWDETIYTQMCVSYGKYGCDVSVPVATGQVHHDAQWCLYVRDDEDGHRGDVCVDPLTYARYQPGNHYPDLR